MIRIILIFLGVLSIVGISIFIFGQSQQKISLLIHPLSGQSNQKHEVLTTSKPIVYGYLPYWTVNTAQLSHVLTNIAFFSIPIHTDGSLLSPRKPIDRGYQLLTKGILDNLRIKMQSNQKLELTLTMLDQDEIRTFLEDNQSFTRLQNDLTVLLSSYKVDGIDIDVEYVDDVSDQQRSYFSSGLYHLFSSLKTTDPNLHLSIAVLSDAITTKRLTDIKVLEPATDHFIVMTYDFHRRSSLKSGPNSPLYSNTQDTIDGKDIMSTLKDYTDIVTPSKILLGVPFYGYEWSVTDQSPQSFTLPHSGQTATYQRISELINSGKAQRHWDLTSLTPYVDFTESGIRHQIYYEDAESIAYKLQVVTQAHLGGIAIWALGFEGSDNTLWSAISDNLKQ